MYIIFCRNAGLQLVKRSRSWSKAAEQIYSPCKLGRLYARYNHASENVYALATNFTSDWRKLFNPRCHDAISASASVRELCKGVNTSGARSGADATAHYRNRRFYWLRVKLYAMVKRKRAEEKSRDTRRQRKRNSASYHPALRGQVFCRGR